MYLSHGAFGTFGILAVVLAELRVAPELSGVDCAVLVARLGTVFLPQQHEGHALADWQAISAMDETSLECRLLASPRPSDPYAQADYGHIHQELGQRRRPGPRI